MIAAVNVLDHMDSILPKSDGDWVANLARMGS